MNEIPTSPAKPSGPPNAVVVRGETSHGFEVSITAAGHEFKGDEPADQGGHGAGPNPYDFLAAALGSCTVMTLNVYARRKQIPLQSVTARVWHSRIHARDCADCETKTSLVDRLERELVLSGQLDASQRQRLLEIADRCPVHRTLKSEISIVTREVSG